MCSIEPVLDTLTKTEREALKAIYRLVDAALVDASLADAGPSCAEAHTGDVADRMGVAPATVTASAIGYSRIRTRTPRGPLRSRPLRLV